MSPFMLSLRRLLLPLCCAALGVPAIAGDNVLPDASPEAPLPALGASPSGWTASGTGAGGFMAVQFQVALSDKVRGVGVQGGGAFNCAGGSARSAALTCTCPVGGDTGFAPLGLMSGIDPAHCMVMPPAVMARRSLDSLHALSPHIQARRPVRQVRVWLHSYAEDATFAPAGLDSVARFYRGRGTSASHIQRITTSAPAIGSRWQGDMLRWLHPAASRQVSVQPLAPRPEGLRAFDQRPFHPLEDGHGLADAGLIYVPAACEPASRPGAACRVHVHFHGCALEAPDPRGLRSLHAWAESLRIVVLHPRAAAEPTRNPGACWDFWGASTPPPTGGNLLLAPAYARADAPQIGAVHDMLDAVTRPAPR